MLYFPFSERTPYYAWQHAQQQRIAQGEPALETALVKSFGHTKRRYGTRRLRVALRQKGHRIGRYRLRGAMRRRGLRAATQGLYAAHHGLDPRAAVRAETAA